MRKLIFGMLLLSIIQVSGASENSFYEEWKANMVLELDTTSEEEVGGYLSYAFGRASSEARNLATLRYKQANDFIANHKVDPVLWWIKGRLKCIKKGFHYSDLRKEGKWNSSENQALIEECHAYYRKALDLDDNPNASEHLGSKMLLSMTGVLAPYDIAKRVYRKALDISLTGESPPYGGERGYYELDLYEFFLHAYADEGDNELYLSTINEVLERYPHYKRAELLKYKQNVESIIAKQKQVTAQQDNYTQPLEAE